MLFCISGRRQCRQTGKTGALLTKGRSQAGGLGTRESFFASGAAPGYIFHSPAAVEIKQLVSPSPESFFTLATIVVVVA
jgi:hypothetical protein